MKKVDLSWASIKPDNKFAGPRVYGRIAEVRKRNKLGKKNSSNLDQENCMIPLKERPLKTKIRALPSGRNQKVKSSELTAKVPDNYTFYC